MPCEHDLGEDFLAAISKVEFLLSSRTDSSIIVPVVYTSVGTFENESRTPRAKSGGSRERRNTIRCTLK